MNCLIIHCKCISPSSLKFGPGLCLYPEFGFGVRWKDRAGPWFGVWLTLVRQVRSSEKGNGPNSGLAGSEFGERMGRNLVLSWEKRWPNPGLAGSEKGIGQTLVWQVWSLVKDRAEPWFGVLVRIKKQAEPWFGRFRVRRKNLWPNHDLSMGSEFGEGTGLNPGLAGSRKGERNRSKYSSAGSEFRERKWPNPGSEFGLRERRKEQDEPWFGRFKVQRKDPG